MNRQILENWFTDRIENLSHEAQPHLYERTGRVYGWLWECNERVEFSYCSPEVRMVLDVPASGFIGQPLALYRLSQSSAARVKNAILANNLPAELPVQYIHRHGGLVDVTIHIFVDEQSQTTTRRLLGFSQVISQPKVELIPVSGGAHLTTTEEIYQPDMAEIEATSDKLLQILERLRTKIPMIKQAPASRVVRNSSMQAVEEQGYERAVQKTLLDRVVVERPTYYQIKMEHRLEWGSKLELTARQQAMVDRYHKRYWGPLGWFQSQMAPRTMLKVSKNWIAVWFEIVEGRSATVVVKYHEPGVHDQIVPFHQFANDSKVVMRLLKAALRRPYHTEEWLIAGLDYLISGKGGNGHIHRKIGSK
jgi:hypothetical protein